MKKYNLKFGFWNINIDPIKEKEANKIIWILSQTRHVKDISFANYAEITFDLKDDKHWNPIAEDQMVFNRRKSNCMVFDIHLTRGVDYYDKLFLYHSNNKRISNWGYVLYNTKTGKSKHTYFIYDDLNDLIGHINKALNLMMRNDDFSMAHYESRGKVTGIDKTEYINWLTGNLRINDWCRKEYNDLPIVTVDKSLYHNSKRFIEM